MKLENQPAGHGLHDDVPVNDCAKPLGQTVQCKLCGSEVYCPSLHPVQMCTPCEGAKRPEIQEAQDDAPINDCSKPLGQTVQFKLSKLDTRRTRGGHVDGANLIDVNAAGADLRSSGSFHG